MNNSDLIKPLSISRNGMKIFAELMLPENGDKPFPLVIISHGFNGASEHSIPYARAFNEAGIAAVIFDFCGGAMESRSDGKMIDMSIGTELQDLKAVMDAVKSLPETDPERIFLMGRSQGGLVSAMLAAEIPSDISGLILFYPAFNIPEQVRDLYPDEESCPDEVTILGGTVGKKYYHDAAPVSKTAIQKAYDGRVLIVHGTSDDIVPYDESERAVSVYKNAVLHSIPEAGHGFSSADFSFAAGLAVDFVKDAK